MAIMLMHFEVDDYDAWKPLFDEDPARAPWTIQTRRSSEWSFPLWIRQRPFGRSCLPLEHSSAAE